MLLGGVGQEHSNDDVVTLCKGYVLVGEVVVGLGKCRRDYVLRAAAEPKTKEALRYFVDAAGKRQTFVERWVGSP